MVYEEGDSVFRYKRLTECYKNAISKNDVIEVDEGTKIIFFSDVHRGDNSLTDEFAHNQNVYFHALERYLEEGFTYIEVGDGDELWEYNKFAHIRSAHSDIFYLIKKYYNEGRFKYIYGNHNMTFRKKSAVKHELYHFYDDYLEIDTPLFPDIKVVESMVLKDEETKKEVLVVHGHQGDFMNDQGWRLSLILMRVFWRYMHMIGFQNPSSPAKNRVKRHKIEKAFSKWIEENKIGILCGHTHRPKLPDEMGMPYLNTGCCVHPRGITGIELIGRKFYLIHWKIRPDKEGRLSISKKVIKGPLSFEELNI